MTIGIYDVLPEYEPLVVDFLDDKSANVLKRNHGINGNFSLHNLNSELNQKRPALERIIIEYQINGNSYPIYTAQDLLTSNYLSEDNNAVEGLIGELAERLAWRLTKTFLKKSDNGDLGSMFTDGFHSANRDNYIVASSENHVLKIKKYPNMILLRKTGRGKFGYERKKELDGLFDYRTMGGRILVVMEAKSGEMKLDHAQLTKELFEPLRELFPNTGLAYLLFAPEDTIHVKKKIRGVKKLRSRAINLYEELRKVDVGTIFFKFKETKEDFVKLTNHVVKSYRKLNGMSLTLSCKVFVSKQRIKITGNNFGLEFILDDETGLYRKMET